MLYSKLKRFARAESGAVTSDFVMLTAAVVGLGMGVVLIVAPGIVPALSGVEPALEAAPRLGELLMGGTNN